MLTVDTGALARRLAIGTLVFSAPLSAQQASPGSNGMWGVQLGEWQLRGMAQVVPTVTFGAPGRADVPFRATGWYLTQPAVMTNLESPGARWVLRTTLNAEGLTQREGELTFGGWGEAFLDKRHPHALLHELVLSVNAFDVEGASLSLSAGRGFVAFGTDDPMARPGLKYPTNHHLSQILERWTVNAMYLRSGWSVEGSVFSGAEPEGPNDLGNVAGFGRSWGMRLARRWGGGVGPAAVWEGSVSHASLSEEHGDGERTALWNGALRHARAWRGGEIYALAEGSVAGPGRDDEYFSILGETQVTMSQNQAYLRVEYARRPEYQRQGFPGTEEFFRYDHGAEPLAATRWLIATVGYARPLPVSALLSVRPFLDLQYFRIAVDRGGVDPAAPFGGHAFWSLSLGGRIFFGGVPMRMGAYGVLDPMTTMGRSAPGRGHEGHPVLPVEGRVPASAAAPRYAHPRSAW